MTELRELQKIFTISQNWKFWNIFLPKNLANDFSTPQENLFYRKTRIGPKSATISIFQHPQV